VLALVLERLEAPRALMYPKPWVVGLQGQQGQQGHCCKCSWACVRFAKTWRLQVSELMVSVSSRSRRRGILG
jgi:hypothetical protein